MDNRTTQGTLDLASAKAILDAHHLTGDRPGFGPDLERRAEQLLPVLQDIQDAYGYLPREVLEFVHGETGIPLSRMYGVITFYTQFHLTPKGKHTVRCCTGTACHVKGARSVADAISEELGVKDGGTTRDMKFTYETVQCLGTCFLAPVVMVGEDYHGGMTQDAVRKTLARYS